jgi:hypothetical protein
VVDVVTFKADVPPAVTDAGVNDTVAPVGAPVADRATDCAEPDVTDVLTVADAALPAATDADAGATDTAKSLAGAVAVPVVNGANV